MKRPLTNSTLLPFVVLSFALLGFAQSSDVRTDPDISAIVSSVNSTNILNTATKMQHFRTGNPAPENRKKGTA